MDAYGAEPVCLKKLGVSLRPSVGAFWLNDDDELDDDDNTTYLLTLPGSKGVELSLINQATPTLAPTNPRDRKNNRLHKAKYSYRKVIYGKQVRK